MYVPVCSVVFPKGSMSAVLEIRESLEASGAVAGEVAQLTEWSFEPYEKGVRLIVLYANTGDIPGLMFGEPRLFHMFGKAEKGRHRENTSENGRALLHALKKASAGAWGYSVG